MKNSKPKRVSDSNQFLAQGSTELGLESWNEAARDSFLRKEFFKVFQKNQDNENPKLTSSIFTTPNSYFIGYLPEGEPEPFYADLIF